MAKVKEKCYAVRLYPRRLPYFARRSILTRSTVAVFDSRVEAMNWMRSEIWPKGSTPKVVPVTLSEVSGTAKKNKKGR